MSIYITMSGTKRVVETELLTGEHSFHNNIIQQESPQFPLCSHYALCELPISNCSEKKFQDCNVAVIAI